MRKAHLMGLLAGAIFSLPAGEASAAFSARVDNPYFPLRPGTTFRYRGVKDGKPAFELFTVTQRVKRIAGARCAVIHDRLFLKGRLAEDTIDWYSQDDQGTVWYFGEATKELDRRGHVISTEGSWKAGVAGARAGVFMPAHPRVGRSFQQEFLTGHAEDRFQVLSRHASVRVPLGVFAHRALLTKEWTPLEPGVVDHKYYVRGIGEVEEVTARGPLERGELVAVTHRP